MNRLWERLRASPLLKGAFLYVIVGALVVFLSLFPKPKDSPLADAERATFDWEMRTLRRIHPRPVTPDVVLVGIDDDTQQAFPEPIALWHKHLARMLHALARARPRAVGVDVTLPERSFDHILPGSDLALMRGMVDM
jgi:CHASE2 domain-containing sensor protein